LPIGLKTLFVDPQKQAQNIVGLTSSFFQLIEKRATRTEGV